MFTKIRKNPQNRKHKIRFTNINFLAPKRGHRKDETGSTFNTERPNMFNFSDSKLSTVYIIMIVPNLPIPFYYSDKLSMNFIKIDAVCNCLSCILNN